MKKFLSTIAAVIILLTATNNILATESNTSSEYNTPIIVNDLKFNASLNSNGQVNMIWDKYAPSGFNYYKIVRSETNSNPFYPENGYIKYTTDPDYLSYTDATPPKGTLYYRICSIAKPERYCSPVITIENNAEAIDNEQEQKQLSNEFAQISMQAVESNGKIKLTWQVDGNIVSGFKIVRSTVNQFPTYPVMAGDGYKYLTNNAVRDYLDSDVKAGKTYYYRVCQYENGKCKSYSNSANVTLSSSGSTDEPTSTEPTTTQSPSPTDNNATPTPDTNSEDKFIIPEVNSFNDTANSPYKTAIEYLKSKGIVQGVPASNSEYSYLPQKTINRAEFVKIIVEGAKKDDFMIASNYAIGCFKDIPSGEWYENYVCYAKNRGIIGGYPDGTFGGDKKINFVEASKILVKVYSLPSEDESGEWYKKYVRTLQNNKYIPSSVNNLDQYLTREEMAELIWRIKETVTDKSSNSLLH